MDKVMDFLNNKTDAYNSETLLRKGEHILMPDLNRDGMIRSQPCSQQGTLTFDARYDRQTGTVGKTLEYNGRKVSAK